MIFTAPIGKQLLGAQEYDSEYRVVYSPFGFVTIGSFIRLLPDGKVAPLDKNCSADDIYGIVIDQGEGWAFADDFKISRNGDSVCILRSSSILTANILNNLPDDELPETVGVIVDSKEKYLIGCLTTDKSYKTININILTKQQEV